MHTKEKKKKNDSTIKERNSRLQKWATCVHTREAQRHTHFWRGFTRHYWNFRLFFYSSSIGVIYLEETSFSPWTGPISFKFSRSNLIPTNEAASFIKGQKSTENENPTGTVHWWIVYRLRMPRSFHSSFFLASGLWRRSFSHSLLLSLL